MLAYFRVPDPRRNVLCNDKKHIVHTYGSRLLISRRRKTIKSMLRASSNSYGVGVNVALTLLVLLWTSSDLYAQWHKTLQAETVIITINGWDSANVLIGVRSPGKGGSVPIYRSTPGEDSWIPMLLDAKVGPGNEGALDFAFKGKDTAWVAVVVPKAGTPGLLRTTNQGISWDSAYAWPSLHIIGGIAYSNFNSLLTLTAITGQSLSSSDAGFSWQEITPYGDIWGGEYANDSVAMFAGWSPRMIYTTNRGRSWGTRGEAISLDAWCEIPSETSNIPGTQSYLVIPEGAEVFRSDNLGESWYLIHDFDLDQSPPIRTVSNAMIDHDGETFAIQIYRLNRKSSTNMISQDGGNTWKDLCGPFSCYRCRGIKVLGSWIYSGAADGSVWLNKTQKPGVYPVLEADTAWFAVDACALDTVIRYSIPLYCELMHLEGAEISNGAHFEFTRPVLSHPLDSLDSVGIRYTPSEEQSDTARLTLHFRAAENYFDTTIEIIGRRTGAVAVTKALITPPVNVQAGDSASFVVTLSDIGELPSVVRIAFRYTETNLGEPRILLGKSWSMQSVERHPGLLIAELLLAAPAENPSDLLRLQFPTYISLDSEAVVSVTDFSYNLSGKPYSKPCAEALSANLPLINGCGTPTLRTKLRSNRPLTVTSVIPNPAIRQTMLNFTLGETSDASLTLIDMLGAVTQSRTFYNLEAGSHSISLELGSFASGTYILRVQAGSSVVSKMIVKQ